MPLRQLLGLTLSLVLGISACTHAPEGIKPVTPFDVNRYLGTWYEIARLDHPFERGLSNISAHYRLMADERIRVVNRGYDDNKQQWQSADGKAYFVQDSNTGHLKVSFFGPFYGAYVIFELDTDYQYAFVTGPNRDYLWLLSRSPVISPALRQHFIQRAEALGFAVEELIWVHHE